MKRSMTACLGVVLGLMLAPLVGAQEPPPSKPAGGPPIAAPPAAPVKPTPQFKPGEAPKLTTNVKEWDFGMKWYGEPCEGEITVKNEGNVDLTITSVKTSCGCTLARDKTGSVWNNKILKPGESDVMKLTYNTRKAAAKVSQNITVESNDPSSPTMMIPVKGEVRHICKMEPADRITFARVERDQVAEQGITLTSQTDKPIDLKLEPVLEGAKFTAALTTEEPGKKWKLTVTTKPPMNVGPNSAEIKLLTGNPEMPTMSVPVSLYVQPRVQVSPAKIFVTRTAQTAQQRIVNVQYPPNKPVKVLSVTSSSDKIKAEVSAPSTPAQPNALVAMTQIKVSLPPGPEIPSGAKLEITTDDPSPEYQKFSVDIVLREDIAQQKPGGIGPSVGPAGPIPVKPAQPGTPAAPTTPAKPGEKPAEKPAEKPVDKPL
ncbi:MAG: DUF1573 domain-containing protein [Planctomycetes bacterium]|nr:DUF1573 domain-containing protein [Planctomycetota bacterium]